MIRRCLQWAIALASLSIVAAEPIRAQTPPAPLNIAPGAPEEVARVPGHFFWLRPNLQAVQDPLNGDIVLLDDEGRVAGRLTLPDGFHIGEVVSEKGEVRLLDRSGERQVAITRNLDLAVVRSLSDAATPRSEPSLHSRLRRSGPQQLQIEGAGRDAGEVLRIRSLLGGELAQAYGIGEGPDGERYVVSEELIDGLPEIAVHVFVHRFDASGRLTGLAHVPLDDMEIVPPNFVTVTGDGAVRMLVPTSNGVTIREIHFSEPPSGVRTGEAQIGEVLRAGKMTREIVVESKVERLSAPVRPRSDVPRFRIRTQTPPISSDEVLAMAQRYLTVNWVMSRENFARFGIENVCQPDRLKFWRRPAKFSPQHIGRTIGPMPYQWGGHDTPDRFKARIIAGALAGDVCTCRSAALDYCLVTHAAGADCSGFLSNVWGIQRRGTAGMLDVSKPLSGLSALRPADALLIPNRHVMLFVGRRSGPALSYVVLESTTKRVCEGVCESVYRPSELKGYRPIRYLGIVN